VPNGAGGFTDKGGFWLPVNLWGPKAEAIATHLRKGARVRVEGTLVQDTWEDRDGAEVSRIEVQPIASTSIYPASRRSPSAPRARPRTTHPLSHSPKPSASPPADAAFPLRETSQARDIARLLGATQKAETCLRGPIAPICPRASLPKKILVAIKRSDAKFAALGGIWRSSPRGLAHRSCVVQSFPRGALLQASTRDTACASE
ncbi:MAG: single-stranded DNA-binding protein, partial [Gammaproteobacteria bacterium]